MLHSRIANFTIITSTVTERNRPIKTNSITQRRKIYWKTKHLNNINSYLLPTERIVNGPAIFRKTPHTENIDHVREVNEELRTDPSPDPTLTLTCCQLTDVRLREG